MRKYDLFFNKGMRPAAVMLLCTCIAFSAASSYIPPVREAAVDMTADSSQEETNSAESEPVTEENMAEETETVMETRDENAPAPYRLNFAYMYPEDSEESYAEILMKELIRKDSQWYAEIYDMANMAPAKLAPRLGRSAASVLGKYNPASRAQNPEDASTWAVEHFKNVRISFSDGDGTITSAVSNAQEILSMASVYAYYNDIDDLDTIRSYVNRLWQISHSYSTSMGEVYYCEGCVSPDQQVEEEEGDSELEGEDTFNTGSTIDTEITIKDSDEETAETDENGEPIEDSDSESDSESTGKVSGTEESLVRSDGTVIIHNTPTTTPSFSGTTRAVETTTSPIESLAETAESVYVEETKPKVTIVRPTESTTEAQKTPGRSTEASGEETLPTPGRGSVVIVRPGETESQTETVPQSSEALETPAVEETSAEAGGQEAPAEEAESVAALETIPMDGEAGEYQVYAATIQSNSGQTADTAASGSQSAAKICPGHIDLKISAKIHTLSESTGLYDLDPIGNTVEEGSSWQGWTSRARAFVRHIERQDWTDEYNIIVTVEGTKAPLSNAEIDSYMNLLPDGTSETRKDIIRFALQSVGKVPYYWGGKASARNYSGNNFGSITIPDHRGRILRGLDCSGWINWVYWSVTGTHLPYEGTEGLKALGRQVNRADLKPGDIIVITGSTPHVIMFLSWTPQGQIQCIHETGSANNVTIGVMTANWPYYRNLLD